MLLNYHKNVNNKNMLILISADISVEYKHTVDINDYVEDNLYFHLGNEIISLQDVFSIQIRDDFYKVEKRMMKYEIWNNNMIISYEDFVKRSERGR